MKTMQKPPPSEEYLTTCFHISRATATPLHEVLKRPKAEIEAWEAHFEQYPPDYILIPQLLTTLLAVMAGNKNGFEHILPWNIWLKNYGKTKQQIAEERRMKKLMPLIDAARRIYAGEEV